MNQDVCGPTSRKYKYKAVIPRLVTILVMGITAVRCGVICGCKCSQSSDIADVAAIVMLRVDFW